MRGSRQEPDGHGFAFFGVRSAFVFLCVRSAPNLSTLCCLFVGRDGSAWIPKAMGYNSLRLTLAFPSSQSALALSWRAKRAETLDSIYSGARSAPAFFAARSAQLCFSREARSHFSAREARRNARLDLHMLISAREARGHFTAREARFPINCAKRAEICSAREARVIFLCATRAGISAREASRSARLDFWFFLGGSRRLWVGRGWVAAARRQIHKLHVGGSRGSRAPGTT